MVAVYYIFFYFARAFDVLFLTVAFFCDKMKEKTREDFDMRRYMEVFHQHCHMQGFTVDKESGIMYWSFTDSVVKTNMESMMIAQCHVSGGHLGDIAYYDGKV